ncbi:acetylornithine deacetylase [Roseovarius sp. 2305UL8-3]|uniref:acetylornithine deacetylase n=1 Tax=Roseovarius conchicola TaxID=3121636 RepID=UPI003529C077
MRPWPKTMRAVEILGDLVAIPSTPGQNNAEWVRYVTDLLTAVGARVNVVPSPLGDCDGLVASIGPDVEGGVVLSGHADVVVVTDQHWTSDPFVMREQDGRLFGRGTADMKGFVACALAMMEEAAALPLTRPLHVAISGDEETTCQSAISLATHVASDLPSVRGVLVGEPTMLRAGHSHKGSYTCVVTVTGRTAHASLPEAGLSATALAARLMVWIDDRSAQTSAPETTTFTVGTITGGIANNIIAQHCQFEWDIRLSPQDDLEEVIAGLQAEADRLLAQVHPRVPEARIDIARTAFFPGFYTKTDHEFAQECLAASGNNGFDSLPYGTEAGLFQDEGLSVMVMGPGSIDQAHTPDEFIEIDQLARCMAQLRALV